MIPSASAVHGKYRFQKIKRAVLRYVPWMDRYVAVVRRRQCDMPPPSLLCMKYPRITMHRQPRFEKTRAFPCLAVCRCETCTVSPSLSLLAWRNVRARSFTSINNACTLQIIRTAPSRYEFIFQRQTRGMLITPLVSNCPVSTRCCAKLPTHSFYRTHDL